MKALQCKTCGSQNIHRDAFAAWSPFSESWELVEVYDKQVWCADCDTEGEDNIIAVELAACPAQPS